VQAGQAVGTVVPVAAASSLRGYQPAAYLAGKNLLARISFVIALLKGTFFAFSLQR
jgi:hypothetical protein